jgi:hypothetical protein
MEDHEAMLPTRQAKLQTNIQIFDVIFGIVAPILCLLIDPVLFSRTSGFIPILSIHLQTFSYLAISVGIISLALWLKKKEKLKDYAGLIASVLLIGAGFSTVVGFLMLRIRANTLRNELLSSE